jgi:CHAD domain-containing protein
MEPNTYTLGDDIDLPQITGQFARQFSGSQVSDKSEQRLYLDTFDWRLLRSGRVLRVEQSKDRDLMVLHGAGDHAECLAVDVQPSLGADQLPPGRLRNLVQPVVKIRSLLPLLQATVAVRTIRLHNSRGKTIAIVQVERWTVCPGGALVSEDCQEDSQENRVEASGMPVFMVLVPIAGHSKAFRRTVHLAKQLNAQLSQEPSFVTATRAAGLRPGEYQAKRVPVLQADMRSDEAMRSIYQSLLQTMRSNEPGLRENLDSEFLHDYRVAVRRTRSLLSQVKNVLPPEKVAHFKEEFKWLGSITGPLRDMDVYLLRMNDYREEFPEQERQHLGALGNLLESKHLEERQILLDAMDSRRYSQLLADWGTFLQRPLLHEAHCSDAALTVIHVVSRRLWRAYRRVFKQGMAICPDTPIEMLHALRIECKKLRYLMEIFASLFPARTLKKALASVKALHNNLGNLNDFSTQQVKLREFSLELESQQSSSPEGLRAISRLVGHLSEKQEIERALFTAEFRAFASVANQARFRKLCRQRRRKR